MKIPDSIDDIYQSEMYHAKIERILRSMRGLSSQTSKYDAEQYWAQSVAYWQTRCAIAERDAYYPQLRQAKQTETA